MLVLPGEIHHLVNLCLGDLVGEDAADADAALVDVEHDARRLLDETRLSGEANFIDRTGIETGWLPQPR